MDLFDIRRSHQDLRAEFHKILDDVLESGNYVLGAPVEQFEREFAAYCQSSYAVAMNSGTSALHLALEAIGLEAGDEVITTSMTFIATSAAIKYLGAKPVFVDVDPVTWNIDCQQIEARITSRTKAILPVHLHGLMANMPAINAIAGKHHLRVIEDSAQAHGAAILDKRAGSFGEIAAFSFYPGKNLGALGEGGAATTTDPSLAERMRLMRNWGAPQRYHHDFLAFNYRMDGIQGGFLAAKLKRLDAWTEERRIIARAYTDALSRVGFICPTELAGYRHVFHVYAILVKNRESLADAFNREGIGFGIHYPIPVHLQKAFRELGYKAGDFPVAEYLANHFFSLPIFPGMSTSEINRVVDLVTANGEPAAPYTAY